MTTARSRQKDRRCSRARKPHLVGVFVHQRRDGVEAAVHNQQRACRRRGRTTNRGQLREERTHTGERSRLERDESSSAAASGRA